MANASLAPETLSAPNGPSLLGPAVVCVGRITSEEDLTIRGAFEGSLKLEGRRLRIDPGAEVESDVEAGSVVLAGTLTGNIKATGTVTLAREAKMKGDIVAAKVTIQEGAQFRGGIKIVTA